MASASMAKSKKQSKVITLKLSSSVLNRFVKDAKLSSSSSSSTTTTTPAPVNEPEDPVDVKPVPSVSGDNASDANDTPAPGLDTPTPGDGSKKRKAPGTGPRKSLNTNIDTMPKPRGKPGPKKKPRLEDGTIDHSAKAPAVNNANHKLGPKANTGAINAGLRALDRTGTPCRKWARKGFQLKSFTGVIWEIPTWKGGEESALAKSKDGGSTDDTKDISMHSLSDAKANGSDAALSTVDDQVDAMALSTPNASSPAPIPTMTAIAA